MADSKTAAQTAEHAQCSRGKSERIAVRFQISGRVQGVGFAILRWRQARGIGIGGWVKNLPIAGSRLMPKDLSRRSGNSRPLCGKARPCLGWTR